MKPWRGPHRLGPMRLRCLLAFTAVYVAAAQDANFSANANVVMIYATVLDPKGRTIRSLAKDDFTFEEDGTPQTIRYFSREFNAPIAIGLLVDTCQQPRTLPLEKTASYAFLDRVLGSSDKAFVLDLGNRNLVQNFTNSHEKIESAIASLKLNFYQGGGGCRILQGVQQASEMLKPESSRKAIILLSSGMDHKGKVSLTTSIEFAQRGDAMIQSIPFQPQLVPWYLPVTRSEGAWFEKGGRETLQRLSRETGGGYFPVTKDQPIEKIYARIEEELRAQYAIGYIPDQANPNLGYRKLHLTVKNPDFTVHSRDGYYPK
jgi:VWFA-related protein